MKHLTLVSGAFMESAVLRSGLLCVVFCGVWVSHAQVFTVGEKTATADIDTSFKPTRVPLPQEKLTERGRRDLVRNLEAEQGFAHRALPMGAGVTLEANGKLLPGAEEYKQLIYRKGESAAPGDRIVVTAIAFTGNKIVLDLNGGPYAKHRILSHISINDNPLAPTPAVAPTGCRVTLVFEGGVPEISAPEVKALLEPVLDFGVKRSEIAYADTLPPPLKDAIAAHDVLVGMNHRMVLAALGAPETKVREHDPKDPDGPRFEEWVYGHVPQTVKFVRFEGDRVAVVKIAAMGKPLEVHNTNEMGDFAPEPTTREIALGDAKASGEAGRVAPPTLRKPGDPEEPVNAAGRVQFPVQRSSPTAAPVPSNVPPATVPQPLR